MDDAVFDQQQADPIFLSMISRSPPNVVETVAGAVKALLANDASAALSHLTAGRAVLPRGHPGHRLLSTFQVTVDAVDRLRSLGVDATFEQIWNKPAPLRTQRKGPREVSVSRATQGAILDEIRRQLASSAGATACPSCGAMLPPANAVAPLVSHDGTLGHLRMYLDMSAILVLLRQDPGAAEVDAEGADQIATQLVKQAGIHLPVSTCGACETIALAHPLDQERIARFYADAEYHASSAVNATDRTAGSAESFPLAYTKSLFPCWLLDRLGLGTGHRVFDFGCGEGTMLRHAETAGASVAGLDLDRERVSYARRVLGLSDVTATLDDLQAKPQGSFDLVMTYHTLEHVTHLDRIFSSLCRLVTQGGHVAVAVPNGENAIRKDANSPPVYPMLGGDHILALTPAGLGNRLTKAEFEVVEVCRSPSDLRDINFGPEKRDPLSGMPVWSSKLGDCIVIARKR